MRKLVILFLFILLFSSKIYAIGIVSPYLVNNTLKIINGESTIYTITLQNTEDRDIDVKIGYSSEIAKIIDYKEIYTLPAGKIDTKISFNITAPEDAINGDTYTISYSMMPLSSSGEGTLSMVLGMNKKFDVEIIKDPDSFDIRIFIRILFDYAPLIIAVIIILTIVIWKKKKK